MPNTEGKAPDQVGEEGAGRERSILEAALEATSDSVVITDAEGIIEYVNPAFSKISGWSPEEVLGRNPRFLKSDRQDEAFYERMWRTLTAGRTFQGRFVNRRADGSLYAQEASITPVPGPSSRVEHYVGVGRDVTERETLERRLLKAQRAEDMGQIVGGVSHDFRNVLAIVQTQVESAQAAETEGRFPTAELQEIARAAERGTDVVRKLLTLGRTGDLERTPLSLSEMTDELCSALRSVLPERITLELHLPDDDRLGIVGDRGSIEQILVNLATNARDALPGTGTVRIELDRARDFDADSADLVLGDGSARPDGWARLRFEDDGEGMTKRTLNRIFEPFFSTKPRDEGTGIGMAMVARLMGLHGGAVTVRSRPGEGTSVCLYLPISREEGVLTGHEEDDERVAPTRGAGERILVVDDEDALLHAQVRALERLGYRPVAALDGDEAALFLGDHGEEVDLVMTDLLMPGRSGKDLYDEMGILGLREIPVVFMSGHTPGDLAEGALPGRETLFLEKPWTLDQLGRTVAHALSGRPRRPAA